MKSTLFENNKHHYWIKRPRKIKPQHEQTERNKTKKKQQQSLFKKFKKNETTKKKKKNERIKISYRRIDEFQKVFFLICTKYDQIDLRVKL